MAVVQDELIVLGMPVLGTAVASFAADPTVTTLDPGALP